MIRIIEALKKEGFGVLTEIDMRATLKKKLDVDFHNYKILGSCNPPLAYEALRTDDKIGTMLPCNVIGSGPRRIHAGRKKRPIDRGCGSRTGQTQKSYSRYSFLN